MRNFEKLMKIESELTKFGNTYSILSFDQQVNMPSNGSEYRGDLLELLSVTLAKKMKSKKYTDLIQASLIDPETTADELIIVKRIEETTKFSNRIPVSLHGQLSKIQSQCSSEWEKVKKEKKNDKKYLKLLQKYVDLLKKAISYANQGEFQTSYDYLLDGYSRGMTTEQIEPIFNKLKPFIDSTLAKLPVSEDKEFFKSDEDVMKAAQEIAEKIIGQKDSFKLSKSTHPFCSTLGRNDVRITTRIKPGNVLDAIGSTVHESGHATYELGLDKDHYEDVLGYAASIAAHEGISLFYEKHIGESEQMAKIVSESLGFEFDDVLTWMRSINPENLIRTESDEITYQRHIINRFTIEKELFNGDLKVKDIPARWNELYGKDLTPEVGYACDVHWSNGSFGYFPSYTIGHLIGAQLRNKMEQEIELFPNDEINFEGIRNWLTKNYFVHGGRFTTPELVVKATGEELNPEHWMNFITKKHCK